MIHSSEVFKDDMAKKKVTTPLPQPNANQEPTLWIGDRMDWKKDR